MAKLYFRYGAMSSAKTLNLLACAHSYEVQKKQVRVMKPKLDIRFGAGAVRSRAGLDREADRLLTDDSVFEAEMFKGVSCVLVDEAQFLHPRVIEGLRSVAADFGVPVICYGLRTDFRSQLFPGAKRLMELADTIEEVKTTCAYCNRKATMNQKTVDGAATMAGPTVCLGAEEMYAPTCFAHFHQNIAAATGGPVDFEQAWAAGREADTAQKRAGEGGDQASPEAKKAKTAGPAGAVSPATRPTEEPEVECSPLKA